ncbi:MAG: hypothetical protein II934_10060 [Prevotella sp.]|nr:hypothetical protein [Prevotella sp.]
MKKMLLFVVAMLTAATSFAQADNDFEMEDPTWTKTISDAVADPKDVYVNAPLVITNQGDVVKTGTFTQAFEFAGKELDPIAKSAYIVKYDKKGNEVWGNALQGAATVTAITADDAGNVFVAGVFADKVIITSTDGQTAEINGMADNIDQVSGFIASFDKDGKLLAHKTVIPEANWDLFYTTLANEGFYMLDSQFRINKIVVSGEKVYFTVRYVGDCTIDNVKLEGKIYDMGGWNTICTDIYSFAAIELDKSLSNARLLASLSTSEEALIGYLEVMPLSMKLAADGKNVYVAGTGTGDLTITTEKGSEDFSFEIAENGDQERGFVVANVTTGDVNVFHAPVVSSLNSTFFTIADMQIVKEKLFISGSYIGRLAFDNTVASSGACDAFIAALNTNELSVAWAATSAISEGAANKYNEVVNGMLVKEQRVGVLVDVIDMGSKEIIETNMFTTNSGGENASSNALPIHISALTTSIAGIAANSNEGTASTLRYFADEEFVQGIETIDNGTLNIENGAIFNLQGQRVGKAQKGVYIQNGKKVVLK